MQETLTKGFFGSHMARECIREVMKERAHASGTDLTDKQLGQLEKDAEHKLDIKDTLGIGLDENHSANAKIAIDDKSKDSYWDENKVDGGLTDEQEAHNASLIGWDTLLSHLGYQDGVRMSVRYGKLKKKAVVVQEDDSSGEEDEGEVVILEPQILELKKQVKKLNRRLVSQMQQENASTSKKIDMILEKLGAKAI